MTIREIRVPRGAKSVVVHLTPLKFPQNLGGILWRYTPDEKPDGDAGEYTPTKSELPIGELTSIKDCFFRLEGYVVHHNDSPPSPYEVQVAITADGQTLHSEVPEDGGRGEVGTKDEAFLYVFQIREAA